MADAFIVGDGRAGSSVQVAAVTLPQLRDMHGTGHLLGEILGSLKLQFKIVHKWV